MSLFVVGAVLGEGQVSLFVAGAVLGEVPVLLFVGSSKSNLTCEAALRFAFSWSDHSRIILGSCSDRPRIENDVSSVFKDFVRNFAMQFCVAGAVFGKVGS